AALDPASGATRWTVPLPPAALPSGWTPLESDDGNAAPAIAPDGTVYVGNGDGLRAIDGASGAVKWLFASPNVSSSPAIGGDGTIFYGADDGRLYAVTPSGALRFAIPTGGPISSSPAIGGNGTIVFASDDGNLYAVQ
ncbi:MAG TPA: PQQ-binding-like beta-propeller repeat protein, partial [Myxococcales bacterium]|nr:PQQ-binding-like beta-propeller repeat protein [Myxococcales bacterium]